MLKYQVVNEWLGISTKEESPLIKKYREDHSFIYLFHGTDKKNIKSIMNNGLDPKKMGSHWDSSSLEDIEKMIGIKTPVIFLASDRRQSSAYGNTILLCKLYTKNLFFSMAIRVADGYCDEYLYIRKIPVKDIHFPTDEKYEQLIESIPYLK